jgi:hypothetical protein
MLVCGAAWAQKSLGDVAGSIKLDPSAVVEKQGYTEDPAAAVRADRELLAAVLADCWTAANRLVLLVEEARTSFIYTDDGGLPERLTNAALDLDIQFEEVELLRLDGVYRPSLETARDAADICAGASVAVRDELALRGVRFADAFEEATRCRTRLEEATAQLDGAGNATGQVSDGLAGAEATLSDEEIITQRCEAEKAKGDEAFAACTDRQYRAAAALASRTPENEMLAPEVFTAIRALCARQHALDFSLRDECEVDKMTAARLEAE